MNRGREPHARLAQTRERLVAPEPERADVELDEVRLDLVRVDRQAGGVPALREPVRAGVVLGQALDVMLERVDTGRRDDPGLSHGSAEQVLLPPCPLDRLRRAREQRAERAAETLREAERDGVEQ